MNGTRPLDGGGGPPRAITVRGATEHNLRSVDVEIPRNALTAVTGVSGSGKSSLVMDTICREGQRRYLETFSAYVRAHLWRIGRPAARGIDGLSPAVAVDQRPLAHNPRSTVGTLTQLHDFLRLIFARLGSRPARPGDPPLERRLFSWISAHGACPTCRGLGVSERIDPELLVADPARSLRQGALAITTPGGYLMYSQVTMDVLDQVCRAHGFTVDIPWRDLTGEQRSVVLDGSDRIRILCGKHPLESRLRWTGITPRPREEATYGGVLPVMERILTRKRNRSILRFARSLPCATCGGSRLRPEALLVTLQGQNIGELSRLSIRGLGAHVARLRFGEVVTPVASPIMTEIVRRCRLLDELGLGYLTLDRPSTTLSAGEAQRIRLAGLLGVSLRGLLVVLDEPTVGLHPRDRGRLGRFLRGLRDRGNTVIAVEHGLGEVLEADWLVDLGPGAGRGGGEVLHPGPPRELLGEAAGAAARSITRSFLTGGSIAFPAAPPAPGDGALVVRELTRNNLKRITAEFALAALNVVTGVSGAGKSSLLSELAARLDPDADAVERPSGADRIDKLIVVDRSPIGRTPRSNPATYTGLFDQVRELFARLPGARAAGLTRGHFSFNVELGRCETCEGAGVREVGLHFLGTVESRCERCGGRRFASEVLAVTHDGLNVGEVLELTVEEALRFFQGHRKIERFLRAMDRLGLGYLPLGQPSTTLSGGEAQRLKLAAELARPATGRTLYLLDEPASGLHPADVNALIAALGHLVARGNTVIASEHAPEVIRVADRIVDLGPESGDEGGEIVVTGSPAEVMACRRSWTGRALLDAAMAPSGVDAPGRSDRAAEPPIRLEGVTTHNLKRIDVSIPSNALTVITGVSGSGKSSLAFDTLFAEGQQRFVDCFPTHARRLFTRVGEAELEAAQGLRPAIAIAQVRAATNPRSTVGTVTGVFDDYRLLFSRVGVVHCPVCGSPPSGTGCRRCGGEPRPRPSAADLSPNTDQGACRRCKGLGFETRCVPGRLVSDPSRSLLDGAMAGHRAGRYYGEPHGQHMAILRAVGEAHGIDFSRPYADLEAPARRLAMEGAADRVYDVVWSYRRGRRAGDHRFTSTWKGLLGYVDDEYRRKHSDRRGDALLPLMEEAPCPDCAGARLGPAALAVRFSGLNIAELSSRTADESLAFFRALGHREGWRAAAVDELAADLEVRLERLVDAGLGYLSVDRRTDSLSAGEFQRLRLASQIGRGLTGVVYVLDEPTVGLHPRDTARLIRLLDDLKRAGNTVVVVEHDVDVIRSADHVIDVGPGAGDAGGRIVAQGTIAEIRGAPESSTGRWLRRVEAVGPWSRRALEPGLTVRGATVHNLRGLDVEIPSGGIVAVTGVSGSGKSTLVFDVIAATLAAPAAPGAPGAGQARTHPAPVGCRELVTHAPFDAVVRVTSGARGWESATPATAMGASEPIRELFARTPSAVARGLTRAAFSTQVRGGRCESCEGQGQVRVPMDFLPDVWIRCEECGGRRFVADVLACSWEGRTMAEVLEMTVHEAAGLFASHRTIVVPLALLSQAGLGYLRLGQRTSTLSGGELQRLALARELVTARGSRRLYILDEPTTGLHLDDVDRLLGVLRGLVADGHTVLVVEHNLEVIAGADWVNDLGPEGGAGGGRLVVAGTPEQVAAAAGSHTGRFLERRLSGPL